MIKKHTFGILCAILAAFSFAGAAFSETFTLKNDKIEFSVDDKGNVVSFKNIPDNREYAGGQGLWRIILSRLNGIIQ